MSGVEADPVALVEGQLQAYNAHDIDAFCAHYDADIEVALLGEDAPPLRGMAAFRERYVRRFAESPHVHADIEQRIVLGRFVIDLERLTGTAPQVRRVIAIYETGGGLIRRVWFGQG